MTKFEEIWKEAAEKADLRYNPRETVAWELLMKEELKSIIEPTLQQQALPVLTQQQADILNDYKNGSGSLAKYLSVEIKKGKYEYFARAMLDGYTVEKPQLFYLKHIDMSKSNERYDYYLSKAPSGSLGHNSIRKGEDPKLKYILKLTQQEIDSMNTGSYEQIEVEK